MASDGLPSGTFGRKRFVVGSGNRDRDGVRGVESYDWDPCRIMELDRNKEKGKDAFPSAGFWSSRFEGRFNGYLYAALFPLCGTFRPPSNLLDLLGNWTGYKMGVVPINITPNSRPTEVTADTGQLTRQVTSVS
ncbi:hypothetical protein HUJ04_006655 [Dendroctonus ponderosae]|nr:hypothetical protein HUJ04_006655 [Dendroctonus ponderosae]